jgi:uncharacterized 2Fe-2S/4Fe-4S cluster protein (DUF4445 family)
VGLRGDVAEVMNVEAGNSEDRNYLVVVDVGTTTVVAHLVDAHALKTIDARACFNAQGMYGREVTARMIRAEKIGGEQLQEPLVKDINQLVEGLATGNGVGLKDITAVVCAGNTAMGHFLLGLPTRNIRRTPYIATSVEPPPLRAAEVGIQINPRGLLYSLPGVSGWVGGDLTAGILATGMNERDEISLLVDIGTNGEVIVGNREWLMACSASAGPALEGASVECGMRAERGAIEKVWMEGDRVRCQTIGDAPARGICGSGIIDATCVLLCSGAIDRSGTFTRESRKKVVEEKGVKRFVLVEGNEGANGKPVYLTETDIENIVTAKAAIYAAMRIMLRRLDMDFSAIDRVYIAGAFGNYIDIENAICIGLIPDVPRDRVEFAGNTSIKGATLAALYRGALDKIIHIERSTTYYDLMGAEDYVEEFQKAMFLPHTDIESFRSNCRNTVAQRADG